ncbi:MAG: HAD hydrolase family protein [Bacteroidales bacterium]|nr:HAD hydrolase family protein [Bacteroidales bacterium]
MNYRKRLKTVKALLFDVEGVFTGDYFVVAEDVHKPINAKDGFALNYAVKKGFYTGIITGGGSKIVKKKFNDIGVSDVYLSQQFKIEALEDFCAKYSLSTEDVLYMGDDLPDFETLNAVGFSACPADAANEVLEIADYISDKKGGDGCVRDIIEQVMKIQNKWNIDDFKN